MDEPTGTELKKGVSLFDLFTDDKSDLSNFNHILKRAR